MAIFIIFAVIIIIAVLFLIIGYSSNNTSTPGMDKRIRDRVEELKNEHKSSNTFSKNTKKNIDKNIKARHQQIIDESLIIINSTKNIDTLLSRYNDIIDNYTAITTRYDKEYEKKLTIVFNENVIRIFRYSFNEYLKKIESIKTEDKLSDYTSKTIDIGSNLSTYLQGNKERHSGLAEIKKIKDEILSAEKLTRLNFPSNP